MPCSNLCPVCQGSCNIVTFSGGLRYWPCPCCGGAGVRVQDGPAAIVVHGRPAKKRKALSRPDANADEVAAARRSLREDNARARQIAEGRYERNPRAAALR